MKLRYTRQALAELDSLLKFTAEQSPKGAASVQTRLRTVIDLLLDHPSIGQMTTRPGMRRMVVTPYPYVVFYRATDDEIVIHGVRHGARRPSSIHR